MGNKDMKVNLNKEAIERNNNICVFNLPDAPPLPKMISHQLLLSEHWKMPARVHFQSLANRASIETCPSIGWFFSVLGSLVVYRKLGELCFSSKPARLLVGCVRQEEL